jgi:hypothetical protein
MSLRRTAAFFAVLQPFSRSQVAAHVELPNLFGNALEILRLVDVDEARLAFLVDCELGKSLLNEVVSGDGIPGDELRDLGRLKQMQRNQPFSEEAEPSESAICWKQGVSAAK